MRRIYKSSAQQAVSWLEAKKAYKSRITSRPTGRDKLCKELDDYMHEPNELENSNSFNWWSVNKARFPNVAAVARAYLAIPATSVASERMFSKCGLVLSDRRSKISPLVPLHIRSTLFSFLRTCEFWL